MFYKNMKVKVGPLDGDTEVYNIVAGVLLRDTLAPYLFIIFLDYVHRTLIDLMKENGFTLIRQEADDTPPTNYYDRKWHSASYKYSYPSRISAE